MTASESASGDSPKAHYGKIDDPRLTADEMDERRTENLAYEYLCHLEEAKVWIEACINEPLPLTIELEEGLMNGVYLAKLGHFMAPDLVPLKKVFDSDQSRYRARGLHFRHTDNINHWLRGMEDIGLPKIFFPETTDIYDRKNMPRAMYCIHALSLYLFKLGKAPQIQDLYGKIKFTDEEISAMRKELDKYGIQMPTFSKIGGILANEMPVDEAALHAAVIAINEAINNQVTDETVAALENPAAHLVNVNPDLSEEYQSVLYAALSSKAEITRNKSLDPDSSYIPDVYDELLTQAEIQGNINKTNTLRALLRLHDALSKTDDDALLQALRAPQLMLRDLDSQNATFYRARLIEMWDVKKNNNEEDEDEFEDVLLTKEEVQSGVNSANIGADTEHQKSLAVSALNEALESDDASATMTALQNPHLQLPPVCSFAASLYHEEFRNMKQEKEASLEYEEVSNGTTVLSAMAAINQAVDAGDVATTFNVLCEDEAMIANLDEGCRDKYQMALRDSKRSKKCSSCPLLTHHEVQQSVDEVNQQVVDDNERILAVGQINEAVDSGDAVLTLEALQLPGAKLSNVDPRQASHYQFLLARFKQHKATETDDPSAVLWYEEIQNTVDVANQQASEGEKMSIGVFAINIAAETDDANNLLRCLQNPDVYLHSVTPQCSTTYIQKLQQLREEKMAAGDSRSGWMMNRVRDGHKFYFNANKMEYSWEKTEVMKKDYSLLTRDEIQTCVTAVTASYDRELLFQGNEKFIVLLQSRVRGYLARKQYNERLGFMQTQLPAIVKLQSWWRMKREKKRYSRRLSYLQENEEAIIKLQAQTRMHLARRRHQERLQFFKDHEDAVVKIQAYMRSNWVKKDYKALMYGDKPPITVVRRFVHLLDIGDIDYNEEIELQKLRQQVVSDIRSNQHLESDLSQMDIKIGLLVKNRITLQDVVSHHKSLKKYRENSSSSLATAQQLGLRAFTKQSRERLEAYQHLFYLLQTNPVYLAKLIFEVPQSRTTKFMESVILTLYNYASNQREEFLLLRLFETALKEEISSKVDTMSDLVTGNPMVVKMIVGFNRNAQGQGQLRELLNPLVKNMINDRNLLINTNPIDIYKKWVNQTETETGRASGLPYDVTIEQALGYEAVRDRITQSIQALKSCTDMFLDSILRNVSKIPYGMRYMAKVMREALTLKFPEAAEKDILKIVGNLIYYRYINPAIVSPDAFDIIDVSMSKGLSNDQRRNLGSVAKILQFAASNKGFGGDSEHLAVLNPYIMETHKRFRQYFIEVCDVVDPETRFNIDQYTDVTRVTKPVIYISLAELNNTHKLLLEHQDKIAPDPADPLHELLEDLGDAPDIELLVGEASSEDDAASKAQMEKTEISLTLSNKFEVLDDEQSDIHSLLVRTKRMLVDVIRCQLTGDNLPQILGCPATEEEEDAHQALIMRRDRTDQKAINRTATKLVRQQSVVGDTRLPLETMKEKIRRHLEHLEKAGVVSRRNNYQSIINSIVQDIRNQRLYRQRRKQEMVRLRATLKNLAAKRAFFQEQVDYYNQYVKTCLDNLSTKGRKSGRKSMLFKRHSGSATMGSIKYSAAKLHEKGVILEIEGLAINQFKNVLFEISSTERTGVFDVNAKFMGVSMDKVELIFQDLLQLQYEGVAVMPMFDKAKINVNLLIFLLNKKFYGK